jgi:hypothetical protein
MVQAILSLDSLSLSLFLSLQMKVLLELLGLAHRELPIIPNKSQMLIHTWWVATL